MNVQIDPAQLAQRLRTGAGDEPTPALLDVREPEEAAVATLPGARLIPLGELANRLDELDDWRAGSREIVVYCHHGIRSMHALAILRNHGFGRLLNLRGGIDRWSLDVDPAVPRY